jgi:hypothetical protein
VLCGRRAACGVLQHFALSSAAANRSDRCCRRERAGGWRLWLASVTASSHCAPARDVFALLSLRPPVALPTLGEKRVRRSLPNHRTSTSPFSWISRQLMRPAGAPEWTTSGRLEAPKDPKLTPHQKPHTHKGTPRCQIVATGGFKQPLHDRTDRWLAGSLPGPKNAGGGGLLASATASASHSLRRRSTPRRASPTRRAAPRV